MQEVQVPFSSSSAVIGGKEKKHTYTLSKNRNNF